MGNIWTKMKAVACRVICHRVMYGGVAAAYGAGLLGWCDKDIVEAVLVTAYTAMAARG